MKRGFNLKELLIVVAILGILAAVFIPNIVGLLNKHNGNETEPLYSYTGDIKAGSAIEMGTFSYYIREEGKRCKCKDAELILANDWAYSMKAEARFTDCSLQPDVPNLTLKELPIVTSTVTPLQTPNVVWQNCYCYETEEITDVLVMTIRGSNYTELRFQSGDTIRVYDEFWAAGSYSWQGEPKELGLSVGSKYYIKVRTKYQTSCNGIEERDYGCGSWRSAWNTEILEARIIPE